MDDDAISQLIEQMLTLNKSLAELRASVAVLKGVLAFQLNPDDPRDGARQIQDLQDRVLTSDPNASARQQAADVVEAIKLAKKHGGPYES